MIRAIQDLAREVSDTDPVWTPQEVLDLLRSIKRLDLNGGAIEVLFEGDVDPMGLSEFEYGSLTHQILANIEHFMLPPEER